LQSKNASKYAGWGISKEDGKWVFSEQIFQTHNSREWSLQ